jgi:hypothetical protein
MFGKRTHGFGNFPIIVGRLNRIDRLKEGSGHAILLNVKNNALWNLRIVSDERPKEEIPVGGTLLTRRARIGRQGIGLLGR